MGTSWEIVFAFEFRKPILIIAIRNSDMDTFLEKIVLPDGFKIEIYASDVENARSMTVSPSGTIFVGNRKSDLPRFLK